METFLRTQLQYGLVNRISKKRMLIDDFSYSHQESSTNASTEDQNSTSAKLDVDTVSMKEDQIGKAQPSKNEFKFRERKDITRREHHKGIGMRGIIKFYSMKNKYGFISSEGNT